MTYTTNATEPTVDDIASKQISIYNLGTGVFTGNTLFGDPSFIKLNTPIGHAAYGGVFTNTKKVNLNTNLIEDYQPPSPVDSEMYTWAWDKIVTDWVASPTLVNIKTKKWAEVKAERSRRLTGSFTVGTNTFDCNESAMAGATLAAFMTQYATPEVAVAYRQPWVLANNTQVSLTAVEMIAVGVAGKNYVTGLWETSQTLRTQINVAATAEAVAIISWP